jgi:hypothetical protein
MKFALVILLIAAGDGGRAINTDLRFATKEACDHAAEAINRIKPGTWNFPPHAVCVGLY